MERFEGHGITERIAIGTICVLGQETSRVAAVRVEDSEAEAARYRKAVSQAAAELRSLAEQSEKQVGTWDAKIFEVHAMMVEDVDYTEEVLNTIRRQKLCAEYAVSLAGEHFARMFHDMEDSYFRARSQDVTDVTARLIRILKGETPDEHPSGPHILMAKELMPGDLMRRERSSILGIVTEQGTAYSHTSILAKSMNIPTITGIRADYLKNGHMAILDGYRGILIVDPDSATIAEYLHIIGEHAERENAMESANEPAVTKSGKKICLCANIGDISELSSAVRYGAEGIGLLRSEFLFMESDVLPSFEEQLQFYKKVAETMGDRKVVIRTVDIGADKPAPCLPMPEEENPALGCRAIRVSLDNRDMFRTQLKAVFCAGQYGNVSVLYPMISSEWEMKEIAAIADSVRKELMDEGIDASNVKQGIMIETPAAAILSDRLAEYADFFSIGTNDLTQYVLAVDRKNARLERFYDQKHEALLRLIGNVVGNAHRKGIPVSVCGELASIPEATELLIGLGVDELSVSPSLLTKVRKAVRNCEK